MLCDSMQAAEDVSKAVGRLRVTVIRASKLPKMDIIRDCDAYCVLWSACLVCLLVHSFGPSHICLFALGFFPRRVSASYKRMSADETG